MIYHVHYSPKFGRYSHRLELNRSIGVRWSTRTVQAHSQRVSRAGVGVHRLQSDLQLTIPHSIFDRPTLRTLD